MSDLIQPRPVYLTPDGRPWLYIRVEGSEVSRHEAGREAVQGMRLEYGEFGQAEKRLAELSGVERYNVKMVSQGWMGRKIKRLGVWREREQEIKLFLMTSSGGVVTYTRITEEEGERLVREGGDPISCPSLPSSLPHSGGGQGQLLWITGAPGSGKSTSAQLVARQHGWLYYDTDCFGELRNPFIHPDTPNPTMATASQRPLVGEGRKERHEICTEGDRAWETFLKTGELSEVDWRSLDRYWDALCEDILSQRQRLGGDWAVAGCLTHRRIRDRVRLNLGTQVTIVHLDMELEDIRTRLTRRHQESVDILMAVARLCQLVEEEEGVITVRVTNQMTEQQVLETILQSFRAR